MGRDVGVTLSTLATRMKSNLTQCITVDTRTLGLFRIFVGLLILADILLRSRNFWYFYSQEGVVTPERAEAVTREGAFSFFFISSDPNVTALLILINLFVAIQLIVGYKTRLATILAFLFVISFDWFNPFITSYADVLFRMLMFWAIFLPLGERFSIDAVHRDRAPRTQFAGWASAFILSQMVYMYFLNGYIKTDSDVWGTMDAAPRVLGRDEMTFLLGDYIREFTFLLGVGGVIWYYILLGSPLLLLFVGRIRFLYMLVYAGGHFSFAITVRIGAFAYVALAGLLLFVQTQIWEDGKTILEYVGVDHEAIYRRLCALERVAYAVPDVRLPGVTQQQVRKQMYTLSIATIVLVIFLFSVGAYLPLGVVADQDAWHMQQVEETAGDYHIDQPEWSIFAPNPGTSDRYYVFPAETSEGEVIDVYNDRPLAFDRPDDQLQTQYDTYRERFYMNSIRRANTGSTTVTLLGDHICDTYEEEYGIELETIDMYSVIQPVTMDTITTPEDRDPRTSYLHTHTCDGSPTERIDLPEEGLGEKAP